ncbi:MAG: RNA-binding transcriptional accessory protein [Bacteroidetes bacterium GWF2_38_335]|nr:MAG: RNA-binding transcriptional accessory protein [Bacteroidetes bacterium GWF2_38_335]OFY77516.1 MAG: RNA-binding transcriptional accessory protein [Bacteroidetes bacterium RIFOXYA12_FULL_38_20]HBS87188.1 RNA-binding transcriptional accessory protein [Bacteroidales bacterium]
MKQKGIEKITQHFSLKQWQVENTIELSSEGATIPFISRYRKEKTGGLDEVQIADILTMNEKLLEFEKRKEFILNALSEADVLTDEIKGKLDAAESLNELEDIYLPFKPKRKTKAVIAREKGLEPLAVLIMRQSNADIFREAQKFLNDQVENVEDALQGARDIIAEWINENQKVRSSVRRLFEKEAMISSKVIKGKEAEAEKYTDYFDRSELIRKCPSHRLLAMKRGESEGFLRVSVSPDANDALDLLERIVISGNNESAEQVFEAMKDSYKRLIHPSMENEIMAVYKEKADESAIMIFAENLRQLLLAPPLGSKRILAIDPGYRTGCKVVCLNEHGELLHNETIYPHPPQNETGLSVKKISSLVESYNIEAISIGNGTAGRETENFIKRIKFDRKLQVFVVNEAGASVYSASKIARDEFPQYDVTVRGSVSIGRRLMDPLAELVKIEPKSIGVGQYQHDVDQGKLQKSLDTVVESCVNKVGVDLNTASKHLLTYVSGMGPQLAQNVVDFRKENGLFNNRQVLLKVPRMGAKAFEQCAGFLRIRDGKNPLDNTAVHPESYPVVKKMAADMKCSIEDLIKDEEIRKKIDLKNYVTAETGLPTLNDIMDELSKPGRDPRTIIKVFDFAPGIHKIDDLKHGMVVPGIVTNLTNFGAFVDVGVKQDGLIHISNMANKFISNPAEIVSLNQQLMVKVIEVDVARKRIQLSLKDME